MQQFHVNVDKEGTVRWYSDAEMTILHREDGPAVEYTNGLKQWYFNGKLHREDGPAIDWNGGAKVWYRHGVLISDDDGYWSEA